MWHVQTSLTPIKLIFRQRLHEIKYGRNMSYKSHQNSPSPICLTASRSFSCGGTSSQSSASRAQAPTYSPPGPMGFLNLTSCTGSPLNVSTWKYCCSKVQRIRENWRTAIAIECKNYSDVNIPF